MNSWVLGFVLFWTGCIAPARPSPAPVQVINLKSAHTATHRITQAVISNGAYCSATAVGPHALLTATHCELPSDEMGIDGTPVQIKGRIRDDLDHTIYLIDGMTFESWVPLNPNVEIESGQSVHIWGNPGGEQGFYRHGYYTGASLTPVFDGSLRIPAYMFDMNIYKGDSGAGVFTDDGQLVAVLSTLIVMGEGKFTSKFALAYPFAFSPEQLNQAITYGLK